MFPKLSMKTVQVHLINAMTLNRVILKSTGGGDIFHLSRGLLLITSEVVNFNNRNFMTSPII